MPQQTGGNVPAFLAKLWKMVDNPDTDSLICWTDEGNSFCIRNQSEFARSLLPYYYKHSNMASFVRQLNMYGFHKVMSVESGGLKGDKDEIEFAHPYFIRGQDHLLDQIKRKVSVNTRGPGINQQFIPSIKSEKVNEVLCEVGALKERQEDLDGKLDTMRSENEALWGEVLSLRQKHNQQQKIVNKLIQFLVALVQPRGMKRSFSRGMPGLQLAIEDGGEGPSVKQPKREQHDAGPVIQEIQEGMTGSQLSELLSNVPVGTVHEITVTSPNIVIDHPPPTPQMFNTVEMNPVQQETTSSGSQPSKYRLVDPASVNSSLIQKRPVLHREISKEDFDIDISSMQKDLDNLKEMLSGQITLDTSLVSSLFSSDSDTMGGMNLFNENLLNQEEEINLSEPAEVKPVTYNPAFFELTEDDSEEMMHTPNPSPFDVDLNTPQIQEDSQDPMKKFFKK